MVKDLVNRSAKTLREVTSVLAMTALSSARSTRICVKVGSNSVTAGWESDHIG